MQRKQRPFYYASEEQFRWLQIIASKIKPDANLSDIDQLKEIAQSLDGPTRVKREQAAYDGTTDNYTDPPATVDQEEGMEGVVDGIGTLMIDNMGRQSTPFLDDTDIGYVGESASVVFHRKVRDYVQSQSPGGINLPDRFPQKNPVQETLDLVNDEPVEWESPGGSPRSVFSTNPAIIRSRLPPRHLADPLIERFFKHIHSIFWVFPRDQFLRKLDTTYLFYDFDLYPGTPHACDERDRKEIERYSWMCCLFTVLALGSSNDEADHELLKPSELFSIAKSLLRHLPGDESIQSIQALLLMVCIQLID